MPIFHTGPFLVKPTFNFNIPNTPAKMSLKSLAGIGMIGEFVGRIVDTAGDGILAEFPSMVNAVKCAVAIQSKMAERNVEAEPGRCMEFRIGVSIGDVVYDEARIYGDGINVATGLEAIAEPGGICISSKVYEEVSGRIDLAYQDIGEQQLKNIAQPVRVYRVQLGKARTGAERHLTAILAADVAEYSRLVENDEEGTLTQWKAHWHALLEPKIKEFSRADSEGHRGWSACGIRKRRRRRARCR